MAWIESHQTLRDHRKVLIAQSLLKLDRPTLIGHLHLLWWWVLDNAPLGDLSGLDDSIIAHVAEYQGTPSEFVEALIKAGFLDNPNGALLLHDWEDYAGKLIEGRRKNRERMRHARAKSKGENDTWENVQGTCGARAGATVPNSTVPNPTKPKKEKAFVETSDEFRLSKLLLDLILENNPTAKSPNLQTWAKHIDRMIRLDKRRAEEIETIIRWCQADSFWSANILSTAKLRERFDQLTVKMKKGGESNAGNQKPNSRSFASAEGDEEKFDGR